MTTKRLFAILFIFCCTAVGWFILGGALDLRTGQSSSASWDRVSDTWGPVMRQLHPTAYYQAPTEANGRATLRPVSSAIQVHLGYEPKRKGLLWARTYTVGFHGEYTFTNPTPIPQTIFVQFSLPSADASYNNFAYTLNGKPTQASINGTAPITEAVTLAPEEKATLVVAYDSRGLDSWGYQFGNETRVQKFHLQMATDFRSIDFPDGTGSPTNREQTDKGWTLTWDYPDQIGARPIGMDMPKVLNPGPTAARISFFAPVSLLFFFAILVILCLLLKVDLHPMNYFFLAAGCFAFQLLFAYLVDLISIRAAFFLSAIVSLVLVSGYLFLAKGRKFASLAATAQFAYMVLFSYSFFFDGITGLTITIGAIITLAILMVVTAKVNWSEKFAARPMAAVIPPPMPKAATDSY